MQVLPIIAGITLVSIPEISQVLVMTAIPIASVLFVISELLRLPQLLREARRGPLIDHELKEVLEASGAHPDEKRLHQ
jgi:TRAP-type C4-dicarboxylate transport system permease small subunit